MQDNYVSRDQPLAMRPASGCSAQSSCDP